MSSQLNSSTTCDPPSHNKHICMIFVGLSFVAFGKLYLISRVSGIRRQAVAILCCQLDFAPPILQGFDQFAKVPFFPLGICSNEISSDARQLVQGHSHVFYYPTSSAFLETVHCTGPSLRMNFIWLRAIAGKATISST